jgi:hypothetical protein
MSFECCKNCVAPKRHPGCHGHCPEYKACREDYDKRKALLDRERDISIGIHTERAKKVERAMRDRRRKNI